jgi:hypothetical protein
MNKDALIAALSRKKRGAGPDPLRVVSPDILFNDIIAKAEKAEEARKAKEAEEARKAEEDNIFNGPNEPSTGGKRLPSQRREAKHTLSRKKKRQNGQ